MLEIITQSLIVKSFTWFMFVNSPMSDEANRATDVTGFQRISDSIEVSGQTHFRFDGSVTTNTETTWDPNTTSGVTHPKAQLVASCDYDDSEETDIVDMVVAETTQFFVSTNFTYRLPLNGGLIVNGQATCDFYVQVIDEEAGITLGGTTYSYVGEDHALTDGVTLTGMVSHVTSWVDDSDHDPKCVTVGSPVGTAATTAQCRLSL